MQLTGSAFAEPPQSPRCRPIVDETSYWAVPENPQDVVGFLKSHAPRWIPNKGSGSYTDKGAVVSSFVTDYVVKSGWNTNDQLDFSVASVGQGSSGIRADAEVVPPDASCQSDPGGMMMGARRQP
jgi:hypothetical protein